MAAENAVLGSQSVAGGPPVEGTGEVAPPEGVSPMSDCRSLLLVQEYPKGASPQVEQFSKNSPYPRYRGVA
jgi:hypothetical protein